MMTTGKIPGEGITACDVTPNGTAISETDPIDAYFSLKINVERALIDATFNGRAGLVDWRSFYDDYDLGKHFAEIRHIIEAVDTLPARSSSCRTGTGADSPAIHSGEGMTND